MTVHPTWLEKLLNARINFKMFGVYLGTGHRSGYDTETESSDSEDESV